MLVKFYGVRGSIACAGAENQRYGGNTSCVEVVVCGETLIFDAGTGLRKLGSDLIKTQGATHIDAHLFLSHLHWDHIRGFPFFAPAFIPATRLTVWGVTPRTVLDAVVVDPLNDQGHPTTQEFSPADFLMPDPKAGVRAALAGQMKAPNFPVGLDAMRANMSFCDVPEGERIELSPFVTVRHSSVDHPNGCVAWRVDGGGRSVVYATDVELADGVHGAVFEGLVDLARHADLLIFDAMYTPEEYAGGAGRMSRKGWGHSTFEMGAAVAEAAGVKQLALFHHDPAHDDVFMDGLAARAQARLSSTFVAREGLEVNL